MAKHTMDDTLLIDTIEDDSLERDKTEAESREKRKQRAKEKKSGWFTKLFKKDKNDDDEDLEKKPNWLLEDYPYYFYPSYVEHNGYVMSVVELYNRTGANRNMTYADVIELIPVDSFQNVEMYFIVKDGFLKGDKKTRIVQKNARHGKGVISDTQTSGAKEDRDNVASQQAQQADLEDYAHYESYLGAKSDPVVIYQISLVIIAHDRETIDEQIEVLNTLLDQRHEGAQWDSLGGDQAQRFIDTFEPLPIDRFAHTSTGDNYAGINFTVSSGLNDEHGMPVGQDALSLSDTAAYFDMNGTLTKQGLISIPRRSNIDLYTRRVGGDHDNPDAAETNSQPSAASIFAQSAANQAAIDGHRVHHIVLNDWDYFEEGLYYRTTDVPEAFDSYDVSKVTINPLEGFGDVNDVVEIYSRLTSKIVNIFDVLNNLELNTEQRAIILDAIQSFYKNHRLWREDADVFPKRTRLTNIKQPEQFPTMGMFINEFTTLVGEALRQGRESKGDRVEALQSILEQSVSANRAVLGRTTSVKPTNARQVYYNFDNISSDNVRQVQFLNLIEYIIHTAADGDLIVIHGIDNIWTRVLQMVQEAIKAAQKKGIRFLFVSDVVQNHEKSKIPKADMFEIQGIYYTDLDTDMDWSVVGQCLEPEVNAYEIALASELSPTIQAELLAKAKCKVLIHRSNGGVNTFVHAGMLI